MNKVKILRIVTAVLIIIDMAAIFLFSAQQAQQSESTSSSVITAAVKIIHRDFDSWSQQDKDRTVEAYQKLVRKLAHMAEYAVLGALSCAFALTFKRYRLATILCAVFCFLYASSDELHQLFVPGRSGQLSDVLIDTLGSVLGIAAMCLLVFIFAKISKRRIITEEK